MITVIVIIAIIVIKGRRVFLVATQMIVVQCGHVLTSELFVLDMSAHDSIHFLSLAVSWLPNDISLKMCSTSAAFHYV